MFQLINKEKFRCLLQWKLLWTATLVAALSTCHGHERSKRAISGYAQPQATFEGYDYSQPNNQFVVETKWVIIIYRNRGLSCVLRSEINFQILALQTNDWIYFDLRLYLIFAIHNESWITSILFRLKQWAGHGEDRSRNWIWISSTEQSIHPSNEASAASDSNEAHTTAFRSAQATTNTAAFWPNQTTCGSGKTRIRLSNSE